MLYNLFGIYFSLPFFCSLMEMKLVSTGKVIHYMFIYTYSMVPFYNLVDESHEIISIKGRFKGTNFKQEAPEGLQKQK